VRRLGIVLWFLAVTLALAACGETQESSSVTSPPASSAGETPQAAVERLWPDMQELMAEVLGDEAIAGAAPGSPVLASGLYAMSEPLLVQWVLADDAQAVGGDLFAAMCPTPVDDSSFLVSVEGDEGTLAEFLIERDSGGRWQIAEMGKGSGQVRALAAATRTLRRALGEDAGIRSALFLPSGLAFAVGSGEAGQAAVYLTFVDHGEGVGSFDRRLPRNGQLFTPEQLETLLGR